MGIGFLCTANLRDKAPVIKVICDIAHEKGYGVHIEDDKMIVNLCLMGDVFFQFTTREKGIYNQMELCVEAKTNLAGPGFHASAIKFIDKISRVANIVLTVEDETNYWDTQDYKVLQTKFNSWLSTLVLLCKNRIGCDNNRLSLCWSLDQYLPENKPETVVTPFGRFNLENLVSFVVKNGIEEFAKIFFIWNSIQQDALFYRNTALSIMWESCSFMPSHRNEEDALVNQKIIECLEKSIELDSKIEFPKDDYLFICKLHEHSPIAVDNLVNYNCDYPIGYRKGMVSYKLGNISFSIDGSFLFEEEECYIWYDGRQNNWHNIRVSAFLENSGQEVAFSEKMFENISQDYQEFTIENGACRFAYSGQVVDENYTYHQSIAEIISGNQITLITASYENIKGVEWAATLFKSFKAEQKGAETK